MVMEVQAALAAEFGALAADAFHRTRRPGPMLDRYAELFADAFDRTFTKPERKRMVQLYEEQNQTQPASPSPCCAGAQADSR
jgi:hypothetical protein